MLQNLEHTTFEFWNCVNFNIFSFLNETFELILIDKSVGPQESGQQAGVGGGGAGRGRAGARGGARASFRFFLLFPLFSIVFV